MRGTKNFYLFGQSPTNLTTGNMKDNYSPPRRATVGSYKIIAVAAYIIRAGRMLPAGLVVELLIR
jgi:hypothetical protein